MTSSGHDRTVPAEDGRRNRVLDGAIGVFLNYGYQRTTMDDIAKAAEISRPALYLVFRNKADIYRALAERLLEVSLERAREELAASAPLPDRLVAALEAGLLDMMRRFAAAPHGAEILDMKQSLAAGVIASWRQRLRGLLSGAIAAEARDRAADLASAGFSADGLADHLLDGLEGMKQRVTGFDELQAGLRSLARLIDLAAAPVSANGGST